MDLRKLFYVMATAIFCGLALPLSAQTPPPNDDYENRIQLSGDNITFTGTTVGATLQTDELQPPSYNVAIGPGMGPTVWWTWTAPTTAQVCIDLVSYSDSHLRTDGPGYITVWTNVDWTNRTGENHFGTLINNVGHPLFVFPAIAGTKYDIQVMTVPHGTFTLRLVQTNVPIVVVPPQNRLVSLGRSTFLSVLAGDSIPTLLKCQWRFNGTNLPNQTWPILSLDHFDSSMAGTYTVVLSNYTTFTESAAGIVTLRTNAANATLTALDANLNSMTFGITGTPSTSYRIESSTNLIDWQAENSFPWGRNYEATSSVIYNRDGQATFSLSPAEPQKFLRTVEYVPKCDPNTNPPGTLAISEVCINNLRKIRFAKELWGNQPGEDYWAWVSLWDTPTTTELLHYMAPVACPFYSQDPSTDPAGSLDTCYRLNEIDMCPQCTISAPTHILEEPPDTE